MTSAVEPLALILGGPEGRLESQRIKVGQGKEPDNLRPSLATRRAGDPSNTDSFSPRSCSTLGENAPLDTPRLRCSADPTTRSSDQKSSSSSTQPVHNQLTKTPLTSGIASYSCKPVNQNSCIVWGIPSTGLVPQVVWVGESDYP